MHLIIQSYLKTFLKHWVSTLGTLLFIIMLACVVLGLMSTPFQLQMKIQWAKSHSILYDWKVDSTDIDYSESFAFDYFVLDGYGYSAPTSTQSSHLLNPWSEAAPIIEPQDFEKFLQTLQTGEEPPLANQVLLTPSFYLYLDNWATAYLTNKSPGILPDWKWWEYFHPEIFHPGAYDYLTPQEKSFLRNFLVDFARLMTTQINRASTLATSPFTYRVNSNLSPPFNQNILHFFVEDLTKAVNVSLEDGSHWFTDPQKLYLYNAFLEANELTRITDIESWNPEMITNKLKSKIEESNKVSGLALQILNPEFRKVLVSDYDNNVSSYLIANALTCETNPQAMEGSRHRYEVQTKTTFGLSEIIPGNFTPSFSIDVNGLGDSHTYNHVLLNQGREPIYQPGDLNQPAVREIMVSPSFLKKNNLRLGSVLTLPKASFAENIDLNDLESREVAGAALNEPNYFTIVGSGFAYDQLTPGPGFWSFVQPLKDYTYGYLPNNYMALYQKAAFIYSTKNSPLTITSEVKNLAGQQNPYEALVWNDSDDIRYNYGVFQGDTELVTPFSKLSTIASLNNIKIQLVIYLCLGLVSLVLAFIFINFIIKKEINETRRQLGIFKSFGYGIAELSLIFATKTLITITIGIVVGWILSIPLQFFMADNFANSVMFTYQRLYVTALLLVTLFVIIPILFTVVAYLLTLSYLSEPALLLITNRQKMPKHRPYNGMLARALEKKSKGFKYRVSGSFVKTAIGKFVVIQLLFGFSALLYSLLFGARTVMYQVINQSFSQIHSKVDHEYAWSNRNQLVINEASGRLYTLQNLKTWDQDKINYINYKGYNSPLFAMNDDNNPALNSHLNLSRYSFRTFFDALSSSVVQHPSLAQMDLNEWWLLPQSIALERYAEGQKWNPNILSQNYYLYKVLLFKGADYRNNEALVQAMTEMKTTNRPFDDPDQIRSPVFSKSWLSLNWTNPNFLKELQTTFLGLISQDPQMTTNNFFLTDLSRLFAMILAENYINSQLVTKMQELNGGRAAQRYSPTIVLSALEWVYQTAYSTNGKLAKFDPRDSTYWSFTEKNPLIPNNSTKANFDSYNNNIFDVNNLFKNVKGLTFNLLAAAMIAKQPESLIEEAVVNFNNLFYDSSREQLQLLLEMIPENKNWGATSILLGDFNQNSRFGTPTNVYNFQGVSPAQMAQMVTKPGAVDEAYFHGILPYAIAKLYKVKIGDVVNLTTKTTSSVPIRIKIVGINESVTLPLSSSWQINVDYHTFAKTMFSPELQQALGIEQIDPLSAYYFNGIVSHNPMVDGKIKINGIDESLNNIRFVGNQLSASLAKDKWVFSSLWQILIDYVLSQLEESGPINPDLKAIITQLKNQIDDPKAFLITNPMVLNTSGPRNDLVSIPYNLARVGVQDFASTMNRLMFIFLLLQSILLTITLIVVMNIVVDEAAIIILTLRSLGYSHGEINWIIMGPYVFWVIVSFIIAYIISMIAWRLLLLYAQNKWDLIIFFRFSIIDLIVPFCVLAFVMLIGWFASDYSVHRRTLSQITNGG